MGKVGGYLLHSVGKKFEIWTVIYNLVEIVMTKCRRKKSWC